MAINDPRAPTTDGARDIEAAIAAGERIGANLGTVIEIDDEAPARLRRAFTVVPSGWKIEDVTRFVPADERVRATFTAQRVEGFLAYVNEWKDATTRIFADEVECGLVAELDYHEPGEDGVVSERTHRAEWKCPLSDEWQAWKANDGKLRAQAEFALFVEDHAPDIVEPAPATMLEIARTLSADRKVSFKSAVRLQDGTRQLVYAEEGGAMAGANQDIAVPERFAIAVPIFRGHARVRLEARLRFRIEGGQLAIGYQLWRAAEARGVAFDALVEGVAKETGVPVFRGTVQG